MALVRRKGLPLAHFMRQRDSIPLFCNMPINNIQGCTTIHKPWGDYWGHKFNKHAKHQEHRMSSERHARVGSGRCMIELAQAGAWSAWRESSQRWDRGKCLAPFCIRKNWLCLFSVIQSVITTSAEIAVLETSLKSMPEAKISIDGAFLWGWCCLNICVHKSVLVLLKPPWKLMYWLVLSLKVPLILHIFLQ